MADIQNVSDTARWVAVYRAMETARKDAIFRDPFAARLAGQKGQDIVDNMKQGRRMAWAMIVRTAVFDEMINERIRNGDVDQVVNLAAGLDARPWRMTSLPSSIRWIDVDLPGILDYKLDLMKNEKPLVQYDAVRLDLREAAKRQALFAQLGAQSRRTLVVSEGLLIYLTADDVASLAADLHRQTSFQWWIFDLSSPKLLEWMNRTWSKRGEMQNAPFQFAPAEGTKFFEPYGWEEAEYRSNMDEARRLNREMSMMWLWRILGMLQSRATKESFRRFAGSVLMQRI